jgi:sugar phosphate isomerase/epimerase
MKTNLKMGIPSMIELTTVEESLALCKELGLSFFELNNNFPQYQPNALQPEELIRLSKKYGVSYTFHFDDNMSIADFNPYVAEGYRQTVLDVIELAKTVGIPVLNMHLFKGAYYTMPQKRIFFFEAYEEEYLKNIKLFRDLCEKAIGDSNIIICVENTDGFTEFQKKGLEILLESPVFGLTLDIGHNHCAGYVDEPFYEKHIHRLHHMHIHDCAGGKKDHQALGTGELNLQKYFALAEEHSCTVVLETKTIAGLRQSVEWMN